MSVQVNGYDEDRSVEENQARALFEISDALRELFYAFKYSKGEGLSVAEAIEVGLRGTGSGTPVGEALSGICDSIDRISDGGSESGDAGIDGLGRCLDAIAAKL